MFSVAGRDGLLPRISSFVHYERLTPVVPILVETILSKKKKNNENFVLLFFFLQVFFSFWLVMLIDFSVI